MGVTRKRPGWERDRRLLRSDQEVVRPDGTSAQRRAAARAVDLATTTGSGDLRAADALSLQRTAGNQAMVQALREKPRAAAPTRTDGSAESYKRVARGPDPKVDLPDNKAEKVGGPKRKEGGSDKQKGGFWSRFTGGGRSNSNQQNPVAPQGGQQQQGPQQGPQGGQQQQAPQQQQAAPQVAPARPSGVASTSVVRQQPPGPNTTKTAKGAWGCVDTETVEPTLTPTLVGDKWVFDATDLKGNYGKIVTLVKGCREVTQADPDDDTSSDQIFDLWELGDYQSKWYMLNAVEQHESVHESRVAPALTAVAPQLQLEFAKLQVKKSKSVSDASSALTAVKSSGSYKKACKNAREVWDAKYVQLIKNDHAILTPNAEHAVVDPMIIKLNQDRVAMGQSEWWPKGWPY